MRVISGSFGGRPLRAPVGRATRPTSDRVREALFSMLGQAVSGAHVLDLFAGSGALGIEALSRGAADATFVDSAAAAITAIRANLAGLGLEAQVLRMPVARALACTPLRERQYDLVFIDPPYRDAGGLGEELSAALAGVLAPGARVVTESDRRDPLRLELPVVQERRYGDTLITIHGT